MADPMRSPAIGTGPLERLVGLLRAVRLAPDAASVLDAGVDALAAGSDAVAWVVADVELDGRLEVVAAAGAPAGIAELRAAQASGDEPWRAACAESGLRLAAWEPLDAACLPGARLAIAVREGRQPAGLAGSAACSEIAKLIGAVLDERVDRAVAARLPGVAGRVAWLEASRAVASILRHDLANQLNAISFYSGQLGDDLEKGEADAHDAAVIEDAVASSGALLEQLRAVWREPPEAEVLPVDPSMVVAGILPMLTAVARPRTLAVSRLDPIVVRASQRGLEEAVLAIVVDVCDAVGSAADEIGLEVGVEQLEADDALGLAAGRYAAVSVSALVPAEAESEGPAPTRRADAVPAGGGSRRRAALLADLVPPLPGEPGFGQALAASSARSWGGAVRAERSGGGVRMTILLPEAVSRHRRGLAVDDDGAAVNEDAVPLDDAAGAPTGD